MNPRRSNSSRGGNRYSNSSRGGGYRGSRSGGGYRSGGGPRGGGRPADLPVLLGEPSPSLAKIKTMNMVKLAAKIASLREERARMAAKLEKLRARDPLPDDKIKQGEDTIERLSALEAIAVDLLKGKAERKAQREQRSR